MRLRNIYQAAFFGSMLPWQVACLPVNHTDDQDNAAIKAGTFQNPSANVRPRFRYWVPDASVDLSYVADDIEGAAAAGAGGIELLGYYLYGANPGTFVPVDWSTYGWGTPAWKKLFDAVIQTTIEHNLIMDFAMGPNQGQGVPAHEGDDGLLWDLRLSETSIAVNGSFNDTVPGWNTGKLQAVITATVTDSVVTSGNKPSLPNDVASNRTQVTLATKSLQLLTDKVGPDGHLEVDFASSEDVGMERLIFCVYLYHLNALAQAQPTSLLGPQTPPKDFIQNGSWTVDHFSARGANLMTDFWEKYLLVGGTKEALMKVGNYAWEDSIEIDPDLYWTKELPENFEKRRGYSVDKWYPLLFHQNSLTEHYSTWYITDESDAGNSHIADYRTTLTEGYAEYVEALTQWANAYLDIQWSSQIGYNMAVDMQTVIPKANAPETECLAFSENIDSYRQYTSPANMAGKRVISTECDAVASRVYQQTLPELVWSFRRSIVGSVNNIVFHGLPYSGYYPNTTWPGFTTFTYAFAEMHGRHQPGWEFYSDSIGYIARLQYIFQSGVPKLDLAFYQKLTTYPQIPRNYQPTDLEDAGYSYGYLNPDNLALPGAYVKDGFLAPELQSYKTLIVRGNDTMTVQGAERIAEFAHQGLPIVFSGRIPTYLASFNSKGAVYVNKTLESISHLRNVHHVPYDNLADSISSLGIQPLTKIDTDGTWYTHWRRDDHKNEDYIFVYNDSPMSTVSAPGFSEGTVEFHSTGKPYFLDAWSGIETPILNYTQTSSATTIFFRLAVNQGIIVAFKNHERPGLHSVSASSNVLSITNSSFGLEAHVGCGAQGFIKTSTGTTHEVPSTSAKPFKLGNWTLIVEHWDPPSPLYQPAVTAIKHNTTHLIGDLVSWQEISGLQNVSGRGYYETIFEWPPSDDASGALLSFGPVVHTIRVGINGYSLPPLDTTSATADISKYLRHGINKVQVTVSTTLANVLAPIWEDLVSSGSPPAGIFGAPTAPSSPTNYGLLYPAVITPYRLVKIL
ncbi:secreted protein [Penicillium lagena]|uniref:uncharacterized protein n=1 Tax=Penicillium lagena TaxID=94218 RepID=UPI00253FA7AF|nr:uncharacterized protein N7510_010467 [Penicillium lagena]KAJ5605313.1 secreted protein [Penicillium lagena]